MKLAIVIPCWKRPEVTKFCFYQLKRLIKAIPYEVTVVCVISEKEYGPLCEEFGFEHVWVENDPLGAKINAGVMYALTKNVHYIMMMNSDDVIEPELITDWYRPHFEKRNPFFGINRVTYVKFGTEEAREIVYEFSILGIGKCIRADVAKMAFKRVGYLYPSKLNKGLDDKMMDNLMQLGVGGTTVAYSGMLAKDFKSDVNIWPWEIFQNKGKQVCYKQGYELAS